MMRLEPKEIEDWGNIRSKREAGVKLSSGL